MRDGPSRPRGPRGRSRPSPPSRASRPATRRPAAGSGAATRMSAPRPPSRFTGRAVVLGVVLLALALSYVFPLRIYLGQQAEIAQLRDAQARQQAHIAELEAEAARWEDDEYIRIQARKRLHYVAPGETPLIIVWDDPAEPGVADGAPPTPQVPMPWWDRLWSSVEVADEGQPAVDEHDQVSTEPDGDPQTTDTDGDGPAPGGPAAGEDEGAQQ